MHCNRTAFLKVQAEQDNYSEGGVGTNIIFFSPPQANPTAPPVEPW